MINTFSIIFSLTPTNIGNALPHAYRKQIPAIYVAGPYQAATRELIAENIAVARSVAVSTARLGWFPICPHRITAHFDDDLPDQDQCFLDDTLAPMERCDAVLPINGWRYSRKQEGCMKDNHEKQARSVEQLEQFRAEAQAIYESWYAHSGSAPWVEGGNSTMQEKARAEARRALENAG